MNYATRNITEVWSTVTDAHPQLLSIKDKGMCVHQSRDPLIITTASIRLLLMFPKNQMVD